MEILADLVLAKSPNRIETDPHGHILMSPPLAPLHGRRQAHLAALLHHLLPNGQTLTECPLSRADGVKAIDVAWLAPECVKDIRRLTIFERAPEICIEILSPSHSASEIDEKRLLYFGAGPGEVWICKLDGSITFFA